MHQSFRRSPIGIAAFAFIIIVFGSYVIVAQSVIQGDWRADTRPGKHHDAEKDQDKIHLSFDRRSEKGRGQFGNSYAYDELQGLTRSQALAGGRVSFRLVREAGTIQCDGTFSDGRGSGTFTFTPDSSFLNGMRSRGYQLSEEKQFLSATLDLTLSFVDDIRSAGLGELGLEDVIKARIFRITPQFIAEMKATGFPDMQLEDLVKARIFKIDADYVRQVRSMGFNDRDFEGMVKLRIFKVSPEFLSEIRSAGFPALSAEEVVKFRIFKIDADFARRAKANDPNVTVEDLVRMKIGVHRRDRDDD